MFYCRNSIRYDLFIVYSVSDFIHLSLRRGGIGYSADLRLLRLTPLPWSPRHRERKYCLHVIDFANACLSLRRLGNNKQCGDATHTTKTKRDNFQINLKLPLFCFWLYEQHLICYCSRSPRDSVGARTQNLQLRRLLLYPVELRNHPLAKHNKLCETAFVTFSGAKVIKIYRTTKFLSTIIQILPVTGVVQPEKGELASSPF